MGLYFAGTGRLWFEEYLKNFRVPNVQQRSRRANRFYPDRLLHVLGDSYNHPDWSAVRSFNGRKFPTLIDGEPVIGSDPHAARMVFEKRGDLVPMKSLGRPDRSNMPVLKYIQILDIPHPDGAI